MEQHYVKGKFLGRALVHFDFTCQDEQHKNRIIVLIRATIANLKLHHGATKVFVVLDEECTAVGADELGCNMLIEKTWFRFWAEVLKVNGAKQISKRRNITTGYYGTTGGEGCWIAQCQEYWLWLEPLPEATPERKEQ